MSQILIFNFDGTGNEPKDAEQEISATGDVSDENISNVLKFHLLCGGTVHKPGQGWHGTQQRCFYYPGIGTYGNSLQRKLNIALAPEGGDVADILNRAVADYDAMLPDNSVVLVVGFSRGAALARRFAKLINDRSSCKIIYEAVFDTVASFGKPDLDKKNRPKSEVLFEDCSLPAKVSKALHLVSLDEKRSAFQPTLMNKEDKVLEIWFAGAHSDVGGGYYQDGLSDIALRFFIEWVRTLAHPVTVRSASAIDFDTILPPEADYRISKDDIQIRPDPLSLSHEQERGKFASKHSLDDRLCCVIKDDRPTNETPIVHHTVARRINALADYRPRSLKQIRHQILYPDSELIHSEGIRDHIEMPQRNIRLLDIGDSHEVLVFAVEKYNFTGVMLEKGAHYRFEVPPEQQWFDGEHPCSAEGWDRPDEAGNLPLVQGANQRLRRVPDAKWFELCGALSANDQGVFRIGLQAEQTMSQTGQFTPFANDMDRFYGNNAGKIRVKVTRLS